MEIFEDTPIIYIKKNRKVAPKIQPGLQIQIPHFLQLIQ